MVEICFSFVMNCGHHLLLGFLHNRYLLLKILIMKSWNYSAIHLNMLTTLCQSCPYSSFIWLLVKSSLFLEFSESHFKVIFVILDQLFPFLSVSFSHMWTMFLLAAKTSCFLNSCDKIAFKWKNNMNALLAMRIQYALGNSWPIW